MTPVERLTSALTCVAALPLSGCVVALGTLDGELRLRDFREPLTDEPGWPCSVGRWSHHAFSPVRSLARLCFRTGKPHSGRIVRIDVLGTTPLVHTSDSAGTHALWDLRASARLWSAQGAIGITCRLTPVLREKWGEMG